MAADFQKPAIADAYASVLQSVRDLASDLAKGLDNTGTQNIPVNAIRWSSAANRWEKYNGSAWAPLATQYAIDVATVGGKSVGNANGNVPLSNGTVNANLNADMVDGFHASQTRNVANGVVVRDANGYIQTDYLNTVADVTATAPSHFAVQTGSDNYVRWRTMAAIKSDLGVGSGANNIASAGTYGGVTLSGSNGGYGGFQGIAGRYFIDNASSSGLYNANAGAWEWRWDAGTLNAGTVPWARLSGVPAMNYLPTAGGTMTGVLGLKADVWNTDSSGGQRLYLAAGGSSYYKTGNANQHIFRDSNGSNSDRDVAYLQAGGIWSLQYGWLHDRFANANPAANWGAARALNGNSGYGYVVNGWEVFNSGGGTTQTRQVITYNANCANCANCDCSC